MNRDDPSALVSHEIIYAKIYAQPRGNLKAAMIEVLRQGKAVRGQQRTTQAGSAMVPETLRIIHRPEEIEARLVSSHWESDLIKGAFNRSSVGTLAGHVLTFNLDHSSRADHCHPELARRLKNDTWFCDLHAA